MKTEALEIDLGVAGDRVVFDTGGSDAATIQLAIADGAAFPTSTTTLRRSNDGHTFHALDTPATLTAEGMSARINTGGFRFLAAEVTTAASARQRAIVTCHHERTDDGA